MKTIGAFVAAFLTVLGAGSVSAATLNFVLSGNSAPASSMTFSKGGVTVTAESYRVSGGVFTPDGLVTQTVNGGLGVGGPVTIGRRTIEDSGEVDGRGRQDVLVLTFSELVKNVSTFFRGIDVNGSDDWDVLVDTGMGSFVKIGDDSKLRAFLASGLVKRIAYLADDADDDFRVRRISLSTVPLPAAGWMLIAGMGGLLIVRRRRKAA